jgi:hypothetical protein
MDTKKHMRDLLEWTYVAATLALFIATLNPLAAQSQVEWEWAARGGGPGGDSGSGIAVDGEGNTYVTGHFQHEANFGDKSITSAGAQDVFLAKYDGTGVLLWVVSAGGDLGDMALSVALDRDGYSYITGFFQGTARFGDVVLTSEGPGGMFIARYDPLGEFLWVRSGLGFVIGRDVSVDSAGHVYVAGNFGGSASFGSITLDSGGSPNSSFVLKMNSSGDVLWARRGGGGASDNAFATGIVTNQHGHVYVAGLFTGAVTFGGVTLMSAGGQDTFVTRYDASGGVVWARRGGGANSDIITGIALDEAGGVYVTGRFQHTAGFGGHALTTFGASVFVVKYDESGSVKWARGGATIEGVFGGAAGGRITVTYQGHVHITGNFAGTLKFGNMTIESIGWYDVLLVTYDDQGRALMARRAGGTSGAPSLADGIAADESGNIYVTGYFWSDAGFDNLTLKSSGDEDIFLAKLAARSYLCSDERSTPYWNSEAHPFESNGDGTGHFIVTVPAGISRLILSPESSNTLLIRPHALNGEPIEGFSIVGPTINPLLESQGPGALQMVYSGSSLTEVRIRVAAIEKAPSSFGVQVFDSCPVDNGQGPAGRMVEVFPETLLVSAEEGPDITSLHIEAVYPNPSRGEVNLRYGLHSPGFVRIAVYDMTGREIMRVQDGMMGAGLHEFAWSSSDLPNGIYLVRIESGVYRASSTLVVLGN